MEPYYITTEAEYDLARERGFEPLLGFEPIKGVVFLALDIRFRIEKQRELFGTGHTPQENQRFYRWCWEHKPHYCEECLRPLHEYSATYVSHILTRAAHPEMAHDPRNVNILCFAHHNMWENGRRERMRIYQGNRMTIEQLKKEYGNHERLR